ncbi:thioredoxin family protein [Pseudofrankia sp. DC12]|uniref:thioredoxin family protein n=1 Tax=Pseudofrankia sp. DC12 TaxID=683315 RepID=UPI0005F88B94|nr:thioredoxin family protein [Pseudofrankia sp. DC12]
MTGLWALLAAVLVATVAGLTLRHRDGRFRPARTRRPDDAPAVAEARDAERAPAGGPSQAASDGADDAPWTAGPAAGSLAAELSALGQPGGERATLLQFSTAFCGPCRTTRVVLADVARIVPGVAHIEVDAEAHLGLVRRLGIRRTPTVLVLDGDAREVSRASGAPPSRAAVIAALGPAATPDGDAR